MVRFSLEINGSAALWRMGKPGEGKDGPGNTGTLGSKGAEVYWGGVSTQVSYRHLNLNISKTTPFVPQWVACYSVFRKQIWLKSETLEPFLILFSLSFKSM